MRCETFRNRYDRLGPGGERRPGAVMGSGMMLHLARCPDCSSSVARVEAAIAAWRAEGSGAPRAEELLVDRVMAAVRLQRPPRREVLTRDWLISGLVLAGSLILIPEGRDFPWFRELFGARLILPIALVLGIGLSAFGALFAGSHVDEMEGFARRFARQH